MYQAAEEGEGGRDVGEVGGVEARPNSQNSSETPLNPSKWGFVPFGCNISVLLCLYLRVIILTLVPLPVMEMLIFSQVVPQPLHWLPLLCKVSS